MLAPQRLDDLRSQSPSSPVCTSRRSRGLDERRAGVDVQLPDEVAARRGGGRRRRRRRSGPRAIAFDRAEHGAGLHVDDRERGGLAGPQQHARRRIVGALPRPSLHSSASAPGARQPARVPRRRGSPHRARRSGPRRRPRERGRREHAGSRGRGSRPRRVRANSVSGSRMKYWSSASSLATSPARPGRATARAAPLLAKRGNGAREADRDRTVERADVDPQLERVRRGDAEQLTRHRAAARSRAAGWACRRRGRAPAGPRGGGLEGGRRRSGGSVRRSSGSSRSRSSAALPRRRPASSRDASPRAAGANPEPASISSGFQSAIVRSGRRRSVAVDHHRRLAEQRLRQLAPGSRSSPMPARTGAPNRRRGRAAWSRRRTLGDVRAEDAAIDMRLVDDDVAEVREQVAPAVVVRQAPSWSMSGLVRITFAHLRICQRRSGLRCRRRRWPGGLDALHAERRQGSGPDPARAPWSGRGRAPGSSARVRAGRAPVG